MRKLWGRFNDFLSALMPFGTLLGHFENFENLFGDFDDILRTLCGVYYENGCHFDKEVGKKLLSECLTSDLEITDFVQLMVLL